MSTNAPEPELTGEPTSIRDRWRDAEQQPVEILVVPEQPVENWIEP
ncbi:hypothetical protein [Acrocarpospora sp. B8E8]